MKRVMQRVSLWAPRARVNQALPAVKRKLAPEAIRRMVAQKTAIQRNVGDRA